ncbi:MAG: hypothetical protein D6705_01000 [Deltaproteobacteria bacterium]|nr:MAG: hypothetical protein D6705_01000 [Deltaproteobacteria bacterium]
MMRLWMGSHVRPSGRGPAVAAPLAGLLAALVPTNGRAAPEAGTPAATAPEPSAGEEAGADGDGKPAKDAAGADADPEAVSTDETATGTETPETTEKLPPRTKYGLRIEIAIQQREAAIAADRTRAIAMLEEFLAKHPGSRAMPEALFRLASLYWERSQDRFLRAMERWAAKVEACKADPESCPEGPPPEPTLDLSDSEALYARMIAEYPNFRKIDTVRYLYAFSLRERGKLAEAQAQFRAIIQLHPHSIFVPDAWLAIGDHAFYVDNDWRAALTAYEHVFDYPESEAYAMALFKAAWCHWKLGEREQAIVRFKQVLDQAGSDDMDAAGRKRLADLREEALEYLVQIISEDESQTPKSIYDFLESIGGAKYSRKVLVRLGEAFEAQTRYDRSVPTWRFLIDLDPDHPAAADYMLHVFAGYRGAAKPKEALDALAELERRYGPNTPWGKQHPRRARLAFAKAEERLYEFARKLHESAQLREKDTKTPDRAQYALAARAYEDYIRRHPASQRAVEISYLLGDIYFFKLDAPEKAGDAYLRVGESAPVGPLHRDALLAAMSAYERALERAPAEAAAPSAPAEAATKQPSEAPRPPRVGEGTDAPESEDAKAPKAADAATPGETLPAAEPEIAPADRIAAKYVHAIDRFIALFPDDDEIGRVLYKLGEFFYARGDYDRAVQRFGRVILEHPDSEEAGAAGDRILESLAKAKDYDNIELWAQKLKGAKAFASDEEQARLDRIIVESLLAQGQSLTKRGYYERAASYFLRVAREYPQHPSAPLALHNAAASLERADRAATATELYEELIERFPKSPYAAEAALVVARVFEKIARYDRAAARYDFLVEHFRKHPQRAEALYNAGILYQALGQHDRAVARYRSYIREFPNREDALDVELRMAQVLADAGKLADADRAFARFVKRHRGHPRTIEARARRGRVLLARGKDKLADKVLSKAVADGRTATGPMRIFAAEARYLQGEIIYRRFERTKLDPHPRKLGDSLERKAKLLARAKDVYLDVLSFKSAEWSTAALYRIGESYEKFAQSLRSYPMPEGLTPEQEDAYAEQLDTFALAFEEQAIEAYKSGYAKALELGIYNRHTQRIREALGRLSKREFPPILEIGGEVQPAEGSTFGGRPVRSLSR